MHRRSLSCVPDDNLATISKDRVTDDTDRARDGQLKEMTTRQEGKIANLLYPIRHLVAGVIEGVSTTCQDLTIP